MTEKKLSIQSSIFWNTVGSMFYLACQWLITVLVVRLSGVETAGILSLCMSVCNIWYCIAVYGMRNFQVSDTLNRYSHGSYIFSRLISCGIAGIGCLLYTLAMPYDLITTICILLYFLYKCSESVFDVYAGIFQKSWRLDLAGKSLLLRGVLTIGSFCILLPVTDNLPVTLAGMAVVCLTAILLYDIPKARKIASVKLDCRIPEVKHLFIECFPLVVYTFLSTAIGSIPKLFLERISGSYDLGVYSSVATPTLIIQMGATYIFNPFVTLFAERYTQKDYHGFLSILKKCTLAVFGIAIAGVLGGKLLGVWGLNLLYGPEIAAYVKLLITLILCTILTAFSWLLCGVLTATRQFRGLVIANILAVISSIIFSPVLEKYFSMQGASMALALATILEIIVLLIYLGKDLRAIKKHA